MRRGHENNAKEKPMPLGRGRRGGKAKHVGLAANLKIIGRKSKGKQDVSVTEDSSKF